MQEIEIVYRFLWIKRKKKRNVPNRWSEISVEQLIAISEHYLGIAKEYEFLAVMCDVSKRMLKKMPVYLRYKLAQQLEFMTDYKPYNTFIIKHWGQFYAPKPRLEGMSFGQFMFADTFYNDWCKDGKDEDLNRFVACLYLPKNYFFDSNHLEAFAKRTARLEPEVKYAISLNYRLIKEWLTEKYPLIFEKPDGDERKKKRPSTGGNGWIRIFESIVGDDIVRQDDYAKLPVNVVLRFISNKIKENAKK
jgi:hypothetical protein